MQNMLIATRGPIEASAPLLREFGQALPKGSRPVGRVLANGNLEFEVEVSGLLGTLGDQPDLEDVPCEFLAALYTEWVAATGTSEADLDELVPGLPDCLAWHLRRAVLVAAN